MYISTPEVKRLISAAFPNFRGKHIKVEQFSGPMAMTSYWSGGSRDYWSIIDMTTGKSAEVPENGTPYTPEFPALPELPINCAVIRYTMGPRESACIYVRPENLAKMLPEPLELSWADKVVLSATRSYKSSYAGIKDYRFAEATQLTGISREEWESAKNSLISRGLLNKAGAITESGRNAIGNTDLYALKTRN